MIEVGVSPLCSRSACTRCPTALQAAKEPHRRRGRARYLLRYMGEILSCTRSGPELADGRQGIIRLFRLTFASGGHTAIRRSGRHNIQVARSRVPAGAFQRPETLRSSVLGLGLRAVIPALLVVVVKGKWAGWRSICRRRRWRIARIWGPPPPTKPPPGAFGSASEFLTFAVMLATRYSLSSTNRTHAPLP